MIAKVLAIAVVLAVLAVFSVHVGKFTTVRELALGSRLSAEDAGKGSRQSILRLRTERHALPHDRPGAY